ncbi:zinc-ribbon domain-containing protein [Enterococcus olivae]
MKYCVQCGSQIKDEASFCPHCGQNQSKPVEMESPSNLVQQEAQEAPVQLEPQDAPVQQEVQEAPVQTESQDSPVQQETQEVPVQPENQNTSAQPEHKPNVMENETVQQTLSAGKSYLSYFLAKLSKPTLSIEQAINYFGYVTLLLFSFFQTLLIFGELRRADRTFRDMFGFMISPFSSSFDIGFSVFLRLFIYFVLFMLVSVGVSYFVVHYILKANGTFHEFVNKFSSVFSGVTLLSFVISLGVLINLTPMTLTIVSILAGVLVTFIATVMVITEKENYLSNNLTPFYSVTLALVVIGILDALVILLF